jgi:hypothetical protein
MIRRVFSMIIWLSALLLFLVACETDNGETQPTEVQINVMATPTESMAEASAPTVVEFTGEVPEPTNTPTSVPTETPTVTPSLVPTDTPSPTPVPTDTPEPTITPTPEPKVVVEVSSMNVRSGPGIAYDIVLVAESGDVFAVTGEAFDCQWLKVTAAEGTAGRLSGDPDIVTLNQPCQAIPAADIPPVPTAAFTPTPETGGMATITLINETTDRGASLYLHNCCGLIQISTHPGETTVRQLPADEYGWYVFSISCKRDLPQLFLTAGMEVVARIIPEASAPCGSYFEYAILGG